jgi:hypothetical protein
VRSALRFSRGVRSPGSMLEPVYFRVGVIWSMWTCILLLKALTAGLCGRLCQTTFPLVSSEFATSVKVSATRTASELVCTGRRISPRYRM